MDSVFFLAILLGTAIGIAVGVGTYLSDAKERKERPQELNHFREELKKAISNKDVTWERVKLLGRRHSAGDSGIRIALETLASRIITDESGGSEEALVRIEEFLKDLEAEQPFQGLPDDIRLRLQQIHEKLSENAHLLQPLAKHLKDSLAESRATRRRERLMNYVSLAVGLGGLCVGILGYWF